MIWEAVNSFAPKCNGGLKRLDSVAIHALVSHIPLPSVDFRGL